MTADGKTSWWLTLPGMLTAIAGTITAVTGLIIALNQAGLIMARSTAGPTSLPPESSSPAPSGQTAKAQAATKQAVPDVGTRNESTEELNAALTKYQDFPEFRVEVLHLRVQANDQIQLVLSYTNRTKKEFLVQNPNADTTALNDDAGNSYRYGGSADFPSNELLLPAKSRAMATLTFYPNYGVVAKGHQFTLNSVQLLQAPVESGTPIEIARHTISLLDVEPH